MDQVLARPAIEAIAGAEGAVEVVDAVVLEDEGIGDEDVERVAVGLLRARDGRSREEQRRMTPRIRITSKLSTEPAKDRREGDQRPRSNRRRGRRWRRAVQPVMHKNSHAMRMMLVCRRRSTPVAAEIGL
jgi:hypothetical protein